MIKSFSVKAGDEIEFLAISWNEENWEFGHPCVLLSPIIRYTEESSDSEDLIEDTAIDLCCGEIARQDRENGFGYHGHKVSYLKRICRERLEGKETWVSKIRSVHRQ
jgi:hypothetical protein